MSLKVLTIFGIAAKLIAVLPVVKAQTSLATCLPEFGWMNNSLHQSPCVVGAYMLGVCNNGEFTVLPLAPSHHYTGPTAKQDNPCQCSTVAYSLMSACGMCQNRTIEGWSAWQTNCSVVYTQQFPGTIPSVTRAPAWAYLDVVKSDTFNATAARADVSAPESTDIGASKSTGVVSITTASTISTIGALATGGRDNSMSKKLNTGTIAGGVVGGLIGLGIITGLIVFFLMRRRQNNIVPHATYNAAQDGAPRGDAPLHVSPMSRYSYINQHPRLYDPNDSSTYPKLPPSPTVHTTTSDLFQQSQPGRYSGAPEL